MSSRHPLRRAATWVSVVAVSLLMGATSARAEQQVTVISTASIQGETKSCGCKKKDLGGLDRRSTLIQEERAKGNPTILVDAGDFGAHQDAEPWMRTEFQWQAMGELGYDAVTPGPNEMLFGVEQFKKLLATNPKIQGVSANVTDSAGNLLLPEFVLIERGGVTFAVTGVTDGSFYAFNKTRGLQKVDDFKFQDVREAIQRVLPQMKGQADIAVVLMHSSPADAKRVVESIPGMDVVIVGHNPGYTFAPERVGQSLIVRPGARGQYTGFLTLTLDDDGTILDYDGKSTPVGKSVAVDTAMETKITAFEAKYESVTGAPKKTHDEDADSD